MGAAQIHPTALVAPGAVLGEDVVVGPYSIVGEHVSVGAKRSWQCVCVGARVSGR